MDKNPLYIKNIKTGTEKIVASKKELSKYLHIPYNVLLKWDGIELLKGVWKVETEKTHSIKKHIEFLLSKGIYYKCSKCNSLLANYVSKCPICGSIKY